MNANITHTTTLATAGKRDIIAIASEPVTGTHLLEAAYGGKVSFHKRRETGTLRRWPVLAPESKERKAAEALEAKVAEHGVAKAAKSVHKSVATVRRTLVSLEFTRSLEAMKARELAAIAKEASANVPPAKPAKEEREPANEAEAAGAEEPTGPKVKPAPKPRAPKGKGKAKPAPKPRVSKAAKDAAAESEGEFTAEQVQAALNDQEAQEAAAK